MIREELKKIIKSAVNDETKSIIKQYGKGYHSEAEFVKILELEIDEVTDDIIKITQTKCDINQFLKAHETISEEKLEACKNSIILAMCELSQCAAVINRFMANRETKIKTIKRRPVKDISKL